MSNRYIYIIRTRAFILLALCCWQACTTSDGDDPQTPQVTNGRVAVDLALCVSNAQGNASATTRMAADIVNQTTFSGIQDIRLIPLNASREVNGDMLTGLERVPTTRHYFSDRVTELNIGTTRFLCYAQSQSEAGQMTATFPSSVSNVDLDDISFSPVPIVTSSSGYSQAEAMATYLTSIAKAEGWSDETGGKLKQYYDNFTNNGNLIAGSTANVKALVNQLKGDIKNLTATTVSTKVLDAIGDVETKITGDYPTNIGLPDGAAAMQWQATAPEGATEEEAATYPKFVVVKQSLGSTPLSDHSRFVHPAPVYYYIDSPVKTANSSQKTAYTDVAWSEILKGYDNGAEIQSSTRSVAVEEPLDYAVGCLAFTIQASADKLTDNDETPKEISLGENTFPLKGILLGGQYKQNCQFVPLADVPATATESAVKQTEYIIYDKDITGISLTDNPSAQGYTLAFQSRDEMPVDIVLEFENKSGQAFTGENGGIVYADTRFYLIGQLWPDTKRSEDYWHRVFTKDYKTTVNLNIQSLKNAYNVIPNLKTAAYALKVSNVAVKEWYGEGYKQEDLYNW